MSILSRFLNFLRRKSSMIDPSVLSALGTEVQSAADRMAAAAAKIAAQAADAAQAEQLKAELATAQAALDAANAQSATDQASIADLTAKLKAAVDSLPAA